MKQPIQETMPTNLIKLGKLDGAALIQTATFDGQTFAWLIEDDRYLVAVPGEDENETACKAWFSRWFEIRANQSVKITRGNNEQGELFIIQIRRNS